MTRRLNLQSPLVFEPSVPLIVRRLAFLAIIAPGLFFGSMAMSFFSGIVLAVILAIIAILSICFCLFALDGIEGKMVVDADGIEWRSPIKKKRLLWNDGLRFKTREFAFTRGVMRVYDVSSADKTISFGENLKNHGYLFSLIDAGINGRTDKNSLIQTPVPPLDTTNEQTVKYLMAASVLLLVGSLLYSLLLIDEAKSLYWTPTVPISDVAKFAGKDTEIRVKGILHTEPPVVSRDGKHSYSFQYVFLGASDGTVLTVPNPSVIAITDGAEKLTVRAPKSRPGDFSESLETRLLKDWQQTDVGKRIATNVDADFKEFEKEPRDIPYRIAVSNVQQDQPVEVIGRVKSENGEIQLQPSDSSIFWLTAPNKQSQQDFLYKAVPTVAAFATGMYLLIAAYLESKKGG